MLYIIRPEPEVKNRSLHSTTESMQRTPILEVEQGIISLI